jgi:hypothetical protein
VLASNSPLCMPASYLHVLPCTHRAVRKTLWGQLHVLLSLSRLRPQHFPSASGASDTDPSVYLHVLPCTHRAVRRRSRARLRQPTMTHCSAQPQATCCPQGGSLLPARWAFGVSIAYQSVAMPLRVWFLQHCWIFEAASGHLLSTRWAIAANKLVCGVRTLQFCTIPAHSMCISMIAVSVGCP